MNFVLLNGLRSILLTTFVLHHIHATNKHSAVVCNKCVPDRSETHTKKIINQEMSEDDSCLYSSAASVKSKEFKSFPADTQCDNCVIQQSANLPSDEARRKKKSQLWSTSRRLDTLQRNHSSASDLTQALFSFSIYRLLLLLHVSVDSVLCYTVQPKTWLTLTA